MNTKIPIVLGLVTLLIGGATFLQHQGPHQLSPAKVPYADVDVRNVTTTKTPPLSSQDLQTLEEPTDDVQVVASSIEQATEVCGARFFSRIHRDNVSCPISDELAATLNDWDVLPFAPPSKKECKEVQLGGGKGKLCNWEPELDPYDGYSDEDLADLALNQGDALAAAKLAYRPMPAAKSYVWLLTAAALSDSNRAAGAILRAAQGFDLQETVADGKAVPNYGGLVRRISLEEIASDNGHPAATPDYWLGQLKDALENEDVSPYLRDIESYKERIQQAMELVRLGAPQSEVQEVLDV